MKREYFMKLAATAFDSLTTDSIKNIGPSDLITQLQSDMVKFAQFSNDVEDLEDMRNSPDFAWLKDEMKENA